MKYLHWAGLMVCAVLLVPATCPRAHADQWNQLTYFTFSAPVEIPGFHGPMVIPAGTYTFKLLDSLSDRDIVQIFNKDQTHLYATVIAIPDYRMKPTGKTVLTFEERVTGSPEAIRAWFYPGNNFGDQFVYPKTRAVELAKANNEPVLSMPDDMASNITKPIKTSKESAATALEKALIKAERANGQEVAASQVVTPKSEQGGH